MEEIKINYKDSGVKTLNGVSYFILILGFFVIAGCIIAAIAMESLYPLLIGILILSACIFIFVSGICLSTITKNSLYNKEYIKAKAQKEGIIINE